MADIMESLGVLGIMDVFTAEDILSRMVDSGVPDATLAQLRQLWDAYQDAILEKKLPPFTKDAEWLPTFNDLVKVTQLPKMTVSAFLTSLRQHAADNSTMQYLDPAQGQASRTDAVQKAKDILSLPGKIVQTASNPIIDMTKSASDAISAPLKWVAIGAASLAVIYVAFQLAPMFKTAKRAAKKRG